MATSKSKKADTPVPEKQAGKPVNELVIDLLQQTEQEILALLDDSRYSLQKGMVKQTFTRLIYRFRMPGQNVTGRERKSFGPIAPRAFTDREAVTPQTLVGEELEQEVNAIYDGFTERETDEILDSLTDLQIRGVAKRAGLEVTETKPVNLTPPFIEEIKSAITKKAAAEALTSDPHRVLLNKIEATEKEVADISNLKDVVQQAIEKEADAAKKEKLTSRLEELTEKEAALYTELETLNNALPNGSD